MDKNYQAFLLRLQRYTSTNHWRASLENAHTGEVSHFANEKELLLYLHNALKFDDNHKQPKNE